MAGKTRTRNAFLGLMILVDIAVFAWFWQSMLRFRRPLDVLLGLVVVLGVLTAVAGGKYIRSVMTLVVTLALCVLAVEMAQKFFDILSLGPKHAVIHGGAGPYPWNSDDAHTYVESKRRAMAAGAYGPPMGERHAGDFFAGREDEVRFRTHERGAGREMTVTALKNPNPDISATGLDFTPDNLIRHHAFVEGGGETLFDARYSINSHGFRQTKGADDAGADAVVFLGCSQTFGFGLATTKPSRTFSARRADSPSGF